MLFHSLHLLYYYRKARGLLREYRESATIATMVEVPEHWWAVWRFSNTPSGWWQSFSALFAEGDVIAVELCRLLLEDIGKSRGISTPEEWQCASWSTVGENNMRLLDRLGGLDMILPMLFSTQTSTNSIRKSIIVTHHKSVNQIPTLNTHLYTPQIWFCVITLFAVFIYSQVVSIFRPETFY